MALNTYNKKEFNYPVPNDAVRLSAKEALDFQWKLIENWDSFYDKWAFKVGLSVLGIGNALSGFYVNHFYRNKTNLGRYGHFASFIPIVFLPATFGAIYHSEIVTRRILLQQLECPLCLKLKSIAVQACFGIAYPMILAPLCAFMLADRFSTYRLPSLRKDPKEIMKYFFKMSKPLHLPLIIMFVLHSINATFITHYEIQNIVTISNKLKEFENKLNNQI